MKQDLNAPRKNDPGVDLNNNILSHGNQKMEAFRDEEKKNEPPKLQQQRKAKFGPLKHYACCLLIFQQKNWKN